MNKTTTELTKSQMAYMAGAISNMNEKQFEQFMMNVNLQTKALLTVPEVMAYTGFGDNAVRNLLNHPRCSFVVRNGNKLYANRKLLDKYLDSISGN